MAQIREKLARGYSVRQRLIDFFAIFVFFGCEAWLLIHILPFIPSYPLSTLLALFIGYVLADFISGFVHWLGDTWGSARTFLAGSFFIRPFREHHVDQKAITRHDFLETNGSNSLASSIVLLPVTFFFLETVSPLVFFLYAVFIVLSLSVFGTNQFHKWAHQDHPIRLIAWLQRKRLILSPIHHAVHHTKPFSSYYCITVGWLNPLLHRTRFFCRLETLIHRLTGAIPRKEDLLFVEEAMQEKGTS